MISIKKPSLIIDSLKVKRNIQNMISKLEDVKYLRPHFKTHQSKDISNIFKTLGVKKITVSSVSMAKYFAKDWNDITIAFPVNILEIDDINNLSKKISLNLLVESIDTIVYIKKNLKNKVGVFIKIDTGYNRTGLIIEDIDISRIIDEIENSKMIYFKGFLAHAGHTYSAKNTKEILSIMDNSKKILSRIKNKYIHSFPGIITSYGDTPSCSISDNLTSFDEYRPGNFVYYDIMQYLLGSCKMEDIAVAVACPVVAIHKRRNEIIIYGGGVHLSKEFMRDDNNKISYGYVVELDNFKWNHLDGVSYLKSLSQEHGIVKVSEELINRIKVGSLIGILPIHSCMTANLLRDSSILV
ncbi:MAG: alanine racemase [Lentimicrobiaceae bacterium]|nr:alanine racemase [Lentimicrobiaceae bacterium]